MEELFPVVFGIMFVAVLVWFGLCYRLFKLLEERHPAKYLAMGKPSLIMNNSLSSNISFMKFLFKREYLELDDPVIAKLSHFMLAFIVVFLGVFAFFLPGMPLSNAP